MYVQELPIHGDDCSTDGKCEGSEARVRQYYDAAAQRRKRSKNRVKYPGLSATGVGLQTEPRLRDVTGAVRTWYVVRFVRVRDDRVRCSTGQNASKSRRVASS